MVVVSDRIQTIARLTPLADVLATIDLDVKPARLRPFEAATAVRHVLGADVTAPPRPSVALALCDGWALLADETAAAGSAAAAPLSCVPLRIEAGQPMPAGTDSVAPVDAVRMTGSGAEAITAVKFGDGVLAVGGDNDPGIPLRVAGERLRFTDLAVLASAGITRVVVRAPRVRVVPLRGSGLVAAAARVVAQDIAQRGGEVRLDGAGRDFAAILAGDDSDAVVAIGGTGSGRNDMSARTLAREGRVAVHGMAITPGETAALGFVGTRPVLLLPGRLDAALAVWLTVGRHLLARLQAMHPGDEDPVETLPIKGEISSISGLSALVPVRRSSGGLQPLAEKYLSLSALARSHGWILVPAEGCAEGALVAVRPWP